MENVNDIKNSKEYSDFREYQEFRKFKAEQWKSARSKAQFTDDAKIQPQDKEIEDAVLGALMLERDAYAIVCDLLRPESFYDPGNQKIYAAINKARCDAATHRHAYRHAAGACRRRARRCGRSGAHL